MTTSEQARAGTLGRCNYCKAPAVAMFSWASRYASRGHWRSVTVAVRACAEHEGCTNWNGHRALRPEALIVRVGPRG